MPYCRRCGTQLEENARFCHKCGTPVDPNVAPQAQNAPAYQPYPAYQQAPPPTPQTQTHSRPMHREPLVIVAIALTVVLVAALIIAAFTIAPVNPWSASETLSDQTAGVDTLNLNFATNIGDVDVVPLQIGDRNILITVVANGSKSALDSSSGPLTLTFDNQTSGGTLNVNSQIRIEDAYTSGANVGITIYVDPALNLNLNVSSTTGDVTFSADRHVFIESLYMQTTTGDVSANLGNATIKGDISLVSTALGNVNYRMIQNALEGNCTIKAKVTAGNVNLDVVETKPFNGDLQVDAEVVTGNINLGLTIDGAVAAQIASQAPALGNINTDINNFSGEETLLQSHNYPSASNIDVSNTVSGLGNINIQADYLTAIIYN